MEGTSELDYPYVTTTSNAVKQKAAQAFETALRSATRPRTCAMKGSGSATGAAPSWIGQYGLDTGQPALSPAAATGQAQTSLQAWERLSLGSRDLVLLDVSKQMATPVAPGGPTLEQVLGQAAGLGLAQFPDSTQLGDWAFASHLDGSVPYKELVPVGPLSAPLGLITRRQEVGRSPSKASRCPPPPPCTGASWPAFRQMTATYQSRYSNAVLVMTAGVDNAPGDMTASALVQQLHRCTTPGGGSRSSSSSSATPGTSGAAADRQRDRRPGVRDHRPGPDQQGVLRRGGPAPVHPELRRPSGPGTGGQAIPAKFLTDP